MDVLQEAEEGNDVVSASVAVAGFGGAEAAEVEGVRVGAQVAEAEPPDVVSRRRALQGRFGSRGRRFGPHSRLLLPLLRMPFLKFFFFNFHDHLVYNRGHFSVMLFLLLYMMTRQIVMF